MGRAEAREWHFSRTPDLPTHSRRAGSSLAGVSSRQFVRNPCITGQKMGWISRDLCIFRQEGRLIIDHFVCLGCVFKHIAGSTFIFNIFFGCAPIQTLRSAFVCHHHGRRLESSILLELTACKRQMTAST